MECGGAALSMNINGCTGKESMRGLKHVMLLFQFPKGNQIVYASCLVSSCRVSRKGHVVWLLIVLLCQLALTGFRTFAIKYVLRPAIRRASSRFSPYAGSTSNSPLRYASVLSEMCTRLKRYIDGCMDGNRDTRGGGAKRISGITTLLGHSFTVMFNAVVIS